ncbi:MAG: NUDIX hydrolase [Candidatus Limnocylindria bacterium]
MERILRAGAGWEEAIADVLRRAPRPIPRDDRLMPRPAGGATRRRLYDRSSFPPARLASTLLAIYPDADGRLVLPLTVRHPDMRAHAGEVSLPGGSVDAADASPEAAALREAWEEIGLDPALVRIAGFLDDVWIPGSNFELRPFVGTVSQRPMLVPHDAEVSSIVELPLEALFDDEVFGTEEFSGDGWRLLAGAYRYGGVRVWGATAFTLDMLAHVLDAAGAA